MEKNDRLSEIVEPVKEFVDQANLSLHEYERLTEFARTDLEDFWNSLAKNEIDWFRMYDRVLDVKNAPFYKFFEGGKLNVSYNCIDRHLDSKRNAPAIVWESETGESRTLTYGGLHEEVVKFASSLKSLGVSRGDAVAIYMPMIPELAIAMLACARIGAVHSVVFAGLSSRALAERIKDVDAKVVVTADGGFRNGKIVPLKPRVDEAAEIVSGIERVVVVEHTKEKIEMLASRDVFYNDLMKGATPYCGAEWMDSEDPFFILYTSGSTGKPKGVLHTTAGYLLWRILTTKWIFDMKDGDTFFSTADIGWISGHSYTLYGPLSVGGTTLLYEGTPVYPDPGQWWRLVEKYGVDAMYTAPTAIRVLMKHGGEWPKKHDLSSLRLLTTGGEKLNRSAWLWYFENVGMKRCPVVDAYGQTETAGHMLSALPIFPQKPGAVGVPLPGIFPGIADEDGNQITGPNRTGSLVFKKPWPSMIRTIWKDDRSYVDTYWKKANGRIYFTGDNAYRDADGYFWTDGRNDDVVNVSAHRISCVEIEGAMTRHGSVSEAAAVGRSSEVTGEEVIAFVVLKDGGTADAELIAKELKILVETGIGGIARPSRIIFTDALPKTRSGKVVKRILRDIANERETVQDLSTIEDLGIVERIREIFKS